MQNLDAEPREARQMADAGNKKGRHKAVRPFGPAELQQQVLLA